MGTSYHRNSPGKAEVQGAGQDEVRKLQPPSGVLCSPGLPPSPEPLVTPEIWTHCRQKGSEKSGCPEPRA